MLALQITNKLILEAAEKRGWKNRVLNVSKGHIAVTLPGGNEVALKSSRHPNSTVFGVLIADHKDVFYELAAQQGVPVPVGEEYASMDQATSFMRDHAPIVVKPLDGGHGDGVSLDVATMSQLEAAITEALKIGQRIVLQKQHSGKDYRLLVIGDRVVSTAMRTPASVVGDGKNTLHQLIEIENTNPLRGQGYENDLTLINVEKAHEYLGEERLQEVPKIGATVRVVQAPNIGQGGTATIVTDTVPDSINELALRAAKVAGARVCGVDIMSDDIQAATPENVVVVEINGTPSFGLHTKPSHGEGLSIADIYLDELASIDIPQHQS